MNGEEILNYLRQSGIIERITDPLVISSLAVALGSGVVAFRRLGTFPNKNFNIDDIEKNLEFKKKENLEINPLIEEKYLSRVKLFIETVSREDTSFDLTALSRNIPTLKIKPSVVNLIDKSDGGYICGYNVIETCYRDYLKSIFHELFHMLSTIDTEEVLFSGFSLYIPSKKLDIGNGINEGYTELLNKRYFKDYLNEEDHTYEKETLLVKYLELIIGKKTMENLYSKASLYGLVEELKKYNNNQEIKKFIYNMDKLLWLERFDNKWFRVKKLAKKTIKEIIVFLTVSYSRKKEMEYKKGNITIEVYQEEVTHYFENLRQDLDWQENILDNNILDNNSVLALSLRKTY